MKISQSVEEHAYINLGLGVMHFTYVNRRLVSSVGGVPDCLPGGPGFEPWPDQHSGP